MTRVLGILVALAPAHAADRALAFEWPDDGFRLSRR